MVLGRCPVPHRRNLCTSHRQAHRDWTGPIFLARRGQPRRSFARRPVGVDAGKAVWAGYWGESVEDSPVYWPALRIWRMSMLGRSRFVFWLGRSGNAGEGAAATGAVVAAVLPPMASVLRDLRYSVRVRGVDTRTGPRSSFDRRPLSPATRVFGTRMEVSRLWPRKP